MSVGQMTSRENANDYLLFSLSDNISQISLELLEAHFHLPEFLERKAKNELR